MNSVPILSGVWHCMSALDLRQMIEEAKAEAKAEAKEAGCRAIIPRATDLCTADLDGQQCDPRIHAGSPGWDGRWDTVCEVIRDVQLHHHHVGRVYIEGGFDGASSRRSHDEGDYEPSISTWEVTVWERG